jgi:hypothetical protein
MAWLAVIAMTATWFAAVPAVSAQDAGLIDDEAYVFEDGQKVTWEAPWLFNEEFSVPERGYEPLFL